MCGIYKHVGKPWSPGIYHSKQLRYQPVYDCTFWIVLVSFNNWNIIHFTNKTTCSECAYEVHQVVLACISANRWKVELMMRRCTGLKLIVAIIYYWVKIPPMFSDVWFLSTPGMTRRGLWMIGFLFVISTPPYYLMWFHHVVRIFVGRWSSGLRDTLPIKVSCRVAIFFRCWLYWMISSLLSHLWSVGLLPHPYWCLICIGCCDLGIPQFVLGGISRAPSSHIPIAIYLWVWRERWGTCWYCRR